MNSEYEVKKGLLEIMEPQMQATRELIGELDGKTMNYETCRVLEKLFEKMNDQWADRIIELTRGLKEKMKEYKEKKENE